jgi:hypothetical protein
MLDMVALDFRIEEELAKHGNLKDFKVVLWRQEPDATGCNWNARIERLRGDSNDSSWWDLVPQLRERFNLR